jgi:hypothetical protein
VITRVIKRKTNRKHMIGDHHGRAVGIATLLLTATDGILGTHRVSEDGWRHQPRITGIFAPRLMGWSVAVQFSLMCMAPRPCSGVVR